MELLLAGLQGRQPLADVVPAQTPDPVQASEHAPELARFRVGCSGVLLLFPRAVEEDRTYFGSGVRARHLDSFRCLGYLSAAVGEVSNIEAPELELSLDALHHLLHVVASCPKQIINALMQP